MDERTFVSKSWGYEDWIVNKPEYCGKLLVVHKGHACNWHYHILKDETFFLVSGELNLSYMDDVTYQAYLRLGMPLADILWRAQHAFLRPGDSFHVPPRMIHRFEAVLTSNLIEFSTQHFDSDSYRLFP